MSELTTAEIPEGLELHKNGTITVHLDDSRIQLRRPKLGEFRRLREAFWEISEAVADKSHELQAIKESMKLELDAAGEDPPADLVAKLRSEDRRLGHELTTFGEDLYVAWFRDAVTLLGDKPLNDDGDDDLPPWAMAGLAMAQILNHWIAVPSPRGVK